MKKTLSICLLFCLLGFGLQVVLSPVDPPVYGVCTQVAKPLPGIKTLGSPDHSMIGNGPQREALSRSVVSASPVRPQSHLATHCLRRYALFGSFRI